MDGIIGGLRRGRGQSLIEIMAEIVGPEHRRISSYGRRRAGGLYRSRPFIRRTSAAHAAEPSLGRGRRDGLGLTSAGCQAPAQALETTGGGLCARRGIGFGRLRPPWRRLGLGGRGLALCLIGAPPVAEGRPLR